MSKFVAKILIFLVFSFNELTRFMVAMCSWFLSLATVATELQLKFWSLWNRKLMHKLCVCVRFVIFISDSFGFDVHLLKCEKKALFCFLALSTVDLFKWTSEPHEHWWWWWWWWCLFYPLARSVILHFFLSLNYNISIQSLYLCIQCSLVHV